MRIKALELLEHHPEHYINLKILGENYKLCSRCTGQYLIGLPAMLITMYLYYFTDITFDFITVFTLTWVLAGLTILDWSSVEILHIRKGSNLTRFITGGTLGVSMSMYFWILPASWMFKIISLSIYSLFFSFLVLIVYCKKNNINILHMINDSKKTFLDFIRYPKKTIISNCGCICCPFTACVPCPCFGSGTSGCISIICVGSCCILPCLCIPFFGGCSKLGFGKKNTKNPKS